MRREIPEDIDLRVGRSEIAAHTGDAVDGSQLTLAKQGIDLHDRWSIKEQVTDHQSSLLASSQFYNSSGVCSIGG